ncbi:MAG: VOC family protein [Methylocystis sp.]|jgi:catechol 2,3-dioxygenase-like lactoylglutathione lyase family enzyme
MNTEIIVHPKLQHYALAATNLDATIDWYRKVLGMSVNYRSTMPPGAPFSAAAFASNDEVHHRVVFFEMPGFSGDSDKAGRGRMQHVAYEYQTLDDLLGAYVRLKGLGIVPVMALDEGMQIAFYYEDPDRNSVELNVNVYGNDWTATEFMKVASASNERPPRTFVDPEKLVEARKAGASPWNLHERAFAGEFAPAKTAHPRSQV